MKFDALNAYIAAVTEALFNYEYVCLNTLTKDSIIRIKEVIVQFIKRADQQAVIDEILCNSESENNYLEVYKMVVLKLCPPGGKSYLVKIPVTDEDVFRDDGRRKKHIYSQIGDNFSSKDAKDYYIKLSLLIDLLNNATEQTNIKILEFYNLFCRPLMEDEFGSYFRADFRGVNSEKNIYKDYLLPDLKKLVTKKI